MSFRRSSLCLIVLAFLTFTGATADAAPYEIAVLQGMDKVTARVSTIRVPVGDRRRFGALLITVHTCDKRPPEETPESAAFLDIRELRQGEDAVDLFRGWMFASSPALSAMEHPVYDVWVVGCENRSSNAESTSPSGRFE